MPSILAAASSTLAVLFVLATHGRAQIAPYCFGDGTGTNCPCSNNGAAGNGCASSANAAGARLTLTGLPSISADTLRLTLTGATPATGSRFFQALNQWNPPNGLPIWDGLRCITVPVVVLTSLPVAGGGAIFPVPGGPDVSTRSAQLGQFLTPGLTVYYQTRYNDAATFCTPAPFNMTNAVAVTWLP